MLFLVKTKLNRISSSQTGLLNNNNSQKLQKERDFTRSRRQTTRDERSKSKTSLDAMRRNLNYSTEYSLPVLKTSSRWVENRTTFYFISFFL